MNDEKYVMITTTAEVFDSGERHETTERWENIRRDDILKFVDSCLNLFHDEDGNPVEPDIEDVDDRYSRYFEDPEPIKAAFDMHVESWNAYLKIKEFVESGEGFFTEVRLEKSDGLTLRIERN